MDELSIRSDNFNFSERTIKFRATNEPVSSDGIKLIAAANQHNLIFIGFENKSIKAILSENIIQVPEIIDLDQFIYNYQLSFKPTILSVSRHGYSSILFVSGISEHDNSSSWPAVELFDIDSRDSIGKLELNELPGARIIDYAWHPTYYESIVALCTDKGHLMVLGFTRKEKRIALVFKNDSLGVTKCCWSPKGENLAIKISNGGVLNLQLVITSSNLTFNEMENNTNSSDGNEEAEVNELCNSCSSILIGGENGRFELPSDENNQERFARGVTVAFSRIHNIHALIFYTSDGILLPYLALDQGTLSIPELQELEDCPLIIPRPSLPPSPPNVLEHQKIAQKENKRPSTIVEELDGLDLPITPAKVFPRASIGQWSIERRKMNMSVRSMVSSMEKQKK